MSTSEAVVASVESEAEQTVGRIQEGILLELHRQLSEIRRLDSSGKQPASERQGSKTTQTTGQ